MQRHCLQLFSLHPLLILFAFYPFRQCKNSQVDSLSTPLEIYSIRVLVYNKYRSPSQFPIDLVLLNYFKTLLFIDLLHWLTFVRFLLLLRSCSIDTSIHSHETDLQMDPNEATFIHYHHSLTPWLPPKNYYNRLMIVPLIQPAVTTANANLVIKMNVGLETAYGATDSDPSFVISDGSRFIGMLTLNKTNYKNVAPCYGIEGTSGPTMIHHRHALLPKPSESYYPGRFEIQLSLSDRWGIEPVLSRMMEGSAERWSTRSYQNKLNPGNGLFLEIYGDNAQEKEGV